MLKFDLLQTDKHSIKICSGGKISDFSVAQIIIRNRCKQAKKTSRTNSTFGFCRHESQR